MVLSCVLTHLCKRYGEGNRSGRTRPRPPPPPFNPPQSVVCLSFRGGGRGGGTAHSILSSLPSVSWPSPKPPRLLFSRISGDACLIPVQVSDRSFLGQSNWTIPSLMSWLPLNNHSSYNFHSLSSHFSLMREIRASSSLMFSAKGGHLFVILVYSRYRILWLPQDKGRAVTISNICHKVVVTISDIYCISSETKFLLHLNFTRRVQLQEHSNWNSKFWASSAGSNSD